jgi:hypothetical protein
MIHGLETTRGICGQMGKGGRTLTDIFNKDGTVWREVGGGGVGCDAWYYFVTPWCFLLLIVCPPIVVLASQGTIHGNADGVTHGRAIGDKPGVHIH